MLAGVKTVQNISLESIWARGLSEVDPLKHRDFLPLHRAWDHSSADSLTLIIEVLLITSGIELVQIV